MSRFASRKKSLKDNHLTSKAVVDSMGIYLTYKDRYKQEQKVQTIELSRDSFFVG